MIAMVLALLSLGTVMFFAYGTEGDPFEFLRNEPDHSVSGDSSPSEGPSLYVWGTGFVSKQADCENGSEISIGLIPETGISVGNATIPAGTRPVRANTDHPGVSLTIYDGIVTLGSETLFLGNGVLCIPVTAEYEFEDSEYRSGTAVIRVIWNLELIFGS